MLELVTQGGALTPNKEAQAVIKQLSDFQVLEAEMKMKKEALIQAFIPAMKKSGIRSINLGGCTLTIKDAYVRKAVDTAKMKTDGIYDQYLKETPVKESALLKFDND